MGYSETSTSTSRQVGECNSTSSRVSSGRVHERHHRVTEYNGSIQPNVSVTSGRRYTHNQCEGTPDSSATPGPGLVDSSCIYLANMIVVPLLV